MNATPPPSLPDHEHGHSQGLGHGRELDWDERYAEADRVWSGQPNGALLAEVAALAVGRARRRLRRGRRRRRAGPAGLGRDRAGRLAGGAARAASHAREEGARVRWVHAGLVEAKLDAGSFDLVSVQCPALLRTPGDDAERALLAAVAPGGTLLVVHHADVDAEHARAHGFDPADYVGHEDIAALLDDGWRVDVDERRPRHVSSGAGAGHTHDLVLRARRLR